jgi:hypothetical protein
VRNESPATTGGRLKSYGRFIARRCRKNSSINNTAAEMPSDQWMPITDPSSPTVMPLNARTGQRGRMEFLEHHPVADHVLDVVGHHGQHIACELGAIGRIREGCE